MDEMIYNLLASNGVKKVEVRVRITKEDGTKYGNYKGGDVEDLVMWLRYNRNRTAEEVAADWMVDLMNQMRIYELEKENEK